MHTLFDDFTRSDPSPASAVEDNFTFLNRVDLPFWTEVRRVLEGWFARYPLHEAGELRKRFRSSLPGQHWAAWWELYLHELFRRLGYELAVHPALPDSTKTPDFELRQGSSRFYLEAAVVFSGIKDDGDGAAPPWLLDAVNVVRNPNFFVRVVEVDGPGGERLKNQEVARPLTEWLDDLDPDAVMHDYDGGQGVPQLDLELGGWELVFEAWPVSPAARGRSDHRVLGGGPIESGWVNDIEQLRSKLKAKAGRYGRPDAPFVTAMLCMSTFMEPLDIEQALFGREAVESPVTGPVEGRLIRQRDGFWIRRDGPQNRRVSAVLTAIALHPWTVAQTAPDLWLNPWANYPLTEQLPFRRATANDRGVIAYSGATPDLATLFGLAADWPGTERFPRSAS